MLMYQKNFKKCEKSDKMESFIKKTRRENKKPLAEFYFALSLIKIKKIPTKLKVL